LLLIFSPHSPKTMELRMLRLLNADRKQHGFSPLTMQEDLRLVARKHSADMAKKDYFDHVNPQFQSPADRLKIAGVSDVTSGENLAKIGGYPNPTQFAEQGLMKSPGHRKNILNDTYNVVGIGVIQDLRKIYYFTQNFAHREIIFQKRIPSLFRRGKTLKVRGKSFSSATFLLCRINKIGQKTPVYEKIFSLRDRKFAFPLLFSETATYEVNFYVSSDQYGNFTLCNRSVVKVYRSFWPF